MWLRLIGHDGAVVMVVAVWAAGDEGALGVGTFFILSRLSVQCVKRFFPAQTAPFSFFYLGRKPTENPKEPL